MQRKFVELLRCVELFAAQVRLLTVGGFLAVVFGGWVRDIAGQALASKHPRPEDIDIVVSGTSSLEANLTAEAERNLFDGFRI